MTDVLEENLRERRLGAASVRPEVVEIFSELVNNAAEHGMTEAGANAHVRFMPHRRGEGLRRRCGRLGAPASGPRWPPTSICLNQKRTRLP